MQEVDFLIVGQGIAGSIISYELLAKNKEIVLFDQGSGVTSTRQAAGLINPITGRRFVKSWLTDELMSFAKNYYQNLEIQFKTIFFKETKVVKVLQSIEQQNDFSTRLNDEAYAKYLEKEILHLNKGFSNPFGTATINPAFQLDTKLIQDGFLNYFKKQNCLKEVFFNYNTLEIVPDGFLYGEYKAKNIIFSEGYLLRNNPFFNYLPIQFAKGEVLIIESEDLKLNTVLNATANINPLGNNRYYVGATHDWSDDKLKTTNEKRAYLIKALDETIQVSYTILEHLVGIRPTVKDRRPLLGEHPKYKNMYVFNGMGTKGLSLAPYFANEMVQHLLEGKELLSEIAIERVK